MQGVEAAGRACEQHRMCRQAAAVAAAQAGHPPSAPGSTVLPSPGASWKRMVAPSERPIQLRCISLMLSAQSRPSRSDSSLRGGKERRRWQRGAKDEESNGAKGRQRRGSLGAGASRQQAACRRCQPLSAAQPPVPTRPPSRPALHRPVCQPCLPSPPVSVSRDFEHPLLHGHAHHWVAPPLAQPVNHLLICQHCRQMACKGVRVGARVRAGRLSGRPAMVNGSRAAPHATMLATVQRVRSSQRHQIRVTLLHPAHLCRGRGTS